MKAKSLSKKYLEEIATLKTKIVSRKMQQKIGLVFQIKV